MTPEEQALTQVHDELVPPLALALGTALSSGGTSPPAAQPISAAYGAALMGVSLATLALLERTGNLTRAQTSRAASRVTDTLPNDSTTKRLIAARTSEIRATVQDWARTHAEAATPTPTADTPSSSSTPAGTDSEWVDQAAQSLATHTASRVSEDAVTTTAAALAPDEPDPRADAPPNGDGASLFADPANWQKIWISRGDSRTRPLHRKLHGQPAKVGKPFWTWPLTGQKLNYPGDREAPIENWINCRCMLFYVPAEVDPSDIVTAFAPDDFDESFDLVASASAFLRERSLPHER